MQLSDYLVGLAFFAVVLGSCLAASTLLVRRRMPELAGAPAVVAVSTLTTAALVAAHLLPGALGLLSRWSAALTAVALLIIAWRLPRAKVDPDLGTPPPSPSPTPSRVLAALGAGGLAAWLVAEAWRAAATPTDEIDSLTFHLPNVARWMQTGTFWQIDQLVPLLAFGNYPHNGDVISLAAVLPWENDAFVRPLGLVFLALAALSAYAVAVELRAPRATAALGAAVFASLPSVLVAASEGAKTDAPLLAAFGAGVLFLVRHRRTGRRADLALAGVGLGLAFGTKWYGVSSVIVVLAVWLAASLVAGGRRRAVARHAAVLGATVAVAGGFWFVRNAVESGNPVFPVDLEVLGVHLLDGPRDVIRECASFTIADYADEPGIVRDTILPALGDRLGLGGGLLAAGLVAAAVLAARQRRRRGTALALAAGSAALALAYTVTPDTAFGPPGQPVFVGPNARYLLPALLVAAPLAAFAAAALGRLRPVAEALAVVAVAIGATKGLETSALSMLAVALLGAALLAARRLMPERPALKVAAAAVAAVALVAAGHDRQQRFNDGRYRSFDPVIDVVVREAAAERPVGLAGVWSSQGLTPVLPAFGERLRNRVEYVGEVVDGQLREFEDRERWRRAVRGGGYELLLVGRGGYSPVCPVPGQASDDDAWARAEGFRVLARSERFTLYRVD